MQLLSHSVLAEVERLVSHGENNEALAILLPLVTNNSIGDWRVYWLLALASKNTGNVDLANLACKALIEQFPYLKSTSGLPETVVTYQAISGQLSPNLLTIDFIPKEQPIIRDQVSPHLLLTCSRFDIPAKFIYAAYRERGIDSPWGRELYEAHLQAFNGCYEDDGSGKTGIKAFVDAFDSLLDSVKSEGFDAQCSLVPVGRGNVAIDGAHRITACLLHNRAVEVARFAVEANSYDHQFFINKGLAPAYCDAIALEYCKLHSHTYVVTVFPSAVGKEREIRDILGQQGEIFYARQVKLNRLGSINLVRQIYDGESWVGNHANQFIGAQHKAAECFRSEAPVRLYIYNADGLEKAQRVKQQIRDLFGISNHAVHINDTHEETLRLARILLNSNSVHFLNNAQLSVFPRFQALLANYKQVLQERGVDGECLCIDGSAVMAAYGIREARDLDYLHFGYDNLMFDYPAELIGSHNAEIGHHVTTRDDIIFNPRNHFYYDGVKFASLGIIRELKQKRGEPKDREDVVLIDRLVTTPPMAPHTYSPSAKSTAFSGKAPKIVGLVPARNEKHIIAQCLRALALFTDAIVYLDDASDDETPLIVESLAAECRVEKIIRKKEWFRDEPGDRNAMLQAGRAIGGTHFIVIDADEMLTSNLLVAPILRDAMVSLQPGDSIALCWIQLWRSIDQYRFDQSVWTWNYKDIIFCDDQKCSYSSEFIHTPRVPQNLAGHRYTLQGYDAGLLHFQFVNWKNLLVKQAWYRCLEHIREPAKPIDQINDRYAPSKEENRIGFQPALPEWLSGYPFFDRSVYDQPEEWREKQVVAWFSEYGREYFVGLDIWDIVWNEAATVPANGREYRVSAIISAYNSERFMRGCLEDLLHQTLYQSGELEIIVIDSASPENEAAIVREYQQHSAHIKYMRTDVRETVYAAWNRGIAMAQGRYITNANTDDRHRHDALELMAKTLDLLPDIDLVYADLLVTQRPNETFATTATKHEYTWPAWDRNLLLDKGCFIGPQPMWRRALHDWYGYFDASFITSGDYEFWLRISQTSCFQHIAQPLGVYLARPDSIEHANEEIKQRENEEIQKLYRDAAAQGELVGMVPLQQLKHMLKVPTPYHHSTEAMGAVSQLDQLVATLASVDQNEFGAYRLHRQALLVQTQLIDEQLARFLTTVQRLLLQGQEWFVRRTDTAMTAGQLEHQEGMWCVLQQASILSQQGNVDEAVRLLLNKGIRAAAHDPYPYLILTELLVAAGRYQDALEVLPEMPDGVDAGVKQEFAACCYCALGEDSAARQAAEQVAQRPRAQVVLGTLAARAGDLATAEQYFKSAVSIDPSCSEGWLALGMLLWGEGQKFEAWSMLQRAVLADPLNAEALKLMRDMAERLNRIAEAVALVARVVQRYLDSRHLALCRSLLLCLTDNRQEALLACEDFLACFGADDELLKHAIVVRSQVGVYDRLSEGEVQSISLCMIVKDEEKTLARCLRSVKPVVHELVVVDTGSTDRTADIARVFGARVVSYQWHDDFAAARNAGLAVARAKWIFVLDADEVISSEDYAQIAQAAGSVETIAWQVVTRNYVHGPTCQGWQSSDGSYPVEELADGWYPSRKVRLFRQDSRIRFQGIVHEMVEPALRSSAYAIRTAGFVVHHYGELDNAAMLDKKLRYYHLGLAKLVDAPDDSVLLTELAVQAAELGHLEEALDLWERVLAHQADNSEALFNRGGVLLLLKRYKESAESSSQALALLPSLKEAWLNFVMASIFLADLTNAKSGLIRLSFLAPDYPPLWAAALMIAVLLDDSPSAVRYAARLRQAGYGLNEIMLQRSSELQQAGHGQLADRLDAWLQEQS